MRPNNPHGHSRKVLDQILDLLLTKYSYCRYYFTLLAMLLRNIASLSSLDLYSRRTADSLDELLRILEESKPDLTDRKKSYALIKPILQKITAITKLIHFESEKFILSPEAKTFHLDLIQSLNLQQNKVYSLLDASMAEILKYQAQAKTTRFAFFSKHEVAIIFWYQHSKHENVAISHQVLQKLDTFCEKYEGLKFNPQIKFTQQQFLNYLDPNKQYLVSAGSLSLMFKSLTKPGFLAGQTTPIVNIDKKKIVKRDMRLTLELKKKAQIQTQVEGQIIITQDSFILPNLGITKPLRKHRVCLFGSGQHADIRLKHKTISKIQFGIICHESDSSFSVVCTSETNHTKIVLPSPIKITEGLIVKIGETDFFNFYKITTTEETIIEVIESDQTVTVTATVDQESPQKVKKLVKVTKLQIQYLTGKLKHKTRAISGRSDEDQKVFTIGPSEKDYDLEATTESWIRYKDGEFQVNPACQILLKSNKEIQNKVPSKKYPLQPGTVIFFDQFEMRVTDFK